MITIYITVQYQPALLQQDSNLFALNDNRLVT